MMCVHHRTFMVLCTVASTDSSAQRDQTVNLLAPRFILFDVFNHRRVTNGGCGCCFGDKKGSRKGFT